MVGTGTETDRPGSKTASGLGQAGAKNARHFLLACRRRVFRPLARPCAFTATLLTNTPTSNPLRQHLCCSLPPPICYQRQTTTTRNPMSMYIIKRDGRRESVHFDKITSRISKLCYGLNPKVRACVLFSCLLVWCWSWQATELSFRGSCEGNETDDGGAGDMYRNGPCRDRMIVTGILTSFFFRQGDDAGSSGRRPDAQTDPNCSL